MKMINLWIIAHKNYIARGVKQIKVHDNAQMLRPVLWQGPVSAFDGAEIIVQFYNLVFKNISIIINAKYGDPKKQVFLMVSMAKLDKSIQSIPKKKIVMEINILRKKNKINLFEKTKFKKYCGFVVLAINRQKIRLVFIILY